MAGKILFGRFIEPRREVVDLTVSVSLETKDGSFEDVDVTLFLAPLAPMDIEASDEDAEEFVIDHIGNEEAGIAPKIKEPLLINGKPRDLRAGIVYRAFKLEAAQNIALREMEASDDPRLADASVYNHLELLSMSIAAPGAFARFWATYNQINGEYYLHRRRKTEGEEDETPAGKEEAEPTS